MKDKLRRILKKHLLILTTAAGAFSGAVVAFSSNNLPAANGISGGYFRALGFAVGRETLVSLFWQFLPLLVMYLFAFGALTVPASSVVLFARAFAGSAGCLLIFRVFHGKTAFLLFWILLCLMELTALLLCHSCGKLSAYYYGAIRKNGVKKRALFRFTSDILFFAGLIFILYLLRGALLTLILRLK